MALSLLSTPILGLLFGLTLAVPDADAGSCSGGQCTPVAGLEGAKAPKNTGSSLELRPSAHLRSATFALG